MTTKKTQARKLISFGAVAERRRAGFDYKIGETFEAGLSLLGAEVKSLREGRADIKGGFAEPDSKGFVLKNISIGKYEAADRFGKLAEKRPRQLLLNAKEIRRLIGVFNDKGSTIIPLRLYFNERGRAKVLLAIATNKQAPDKRRAVKEREAKKEAARAMKR